MPHCMSVERRVGRNVRVCRSTQQRILHPADSGINSPALQLLGSCLEVDMHSLDMPQLSFYMKCAL